MKELLDKLSSYNIFNYLFPGVIFSIILSNSTCYNIIQEDIIIGAFLYYFIGLIISRLGSLFIEPFLKFIRFLKFAKYQDFVSASQKDTKIEVLSEVNNMYRTIISMFLLLILSKLYEYIETKWDFLLIYRFEIIIISLLILFLFSYRKQTKYIAKRVDTNNK
jgi:hypothetical protein